MKASSKLQALFNIQPGEGRLVFLLLLQYFCMGIAFTFVQTTAFTLFLTEFDSQTLSLTYIAMAVILTLLTALYLQLGRRLSFTRLLTVNLSTLLALSLLFGLGLAVTHARWLIFALPILFQIVVNYGNLAFWSLAGRLFNVRQGKRLFGLVGAGQWIAIVCMGFLMPAIVAWLGPANLLWLAAAGMAGGLVTMWSITRLFHASLAEPAVAAETAAHRPDKESSVPALLRNRYARLIFALTLFWWLVFFILDNIFYGRAAAQFPQGADLAGFLGLYLAGLGVLTLISNFLISGRIISRFGLRVSLLILPVGLAIGAVLMTSAGVLGAPLALLFWATVTTKVWGMDVGFSVDQTARTILYQPLPAQLRARVQTLTEGVVQPLATGLAGVLLLALGAFLAAGPLPLMLGLLVVVGALLAIAVLIGCEYTPVLVQALSRRRLTGAELVVIDATSLAILKQGLGSPHTGAVVYALRMLAAADPTALEAVAPTLLRHAAPDVRLQVVETVARLSLRSALPAIEASLSTEISPPVKGAALRSVAQLGDAAARQIVLGYIDDPQPAVRAGALVGLLSGGNGDGRPQARQKLNELTTSPRAGDRALAAQILGGYTDPESARPLLQLMRDNGVAVRRAALRAAGQLKSPLLWPQVVAALGSPTTRIAAAAVLGEGGEAVLPEMSAALESATTDRAMCLQLTRILGRIRGPRAIELLKRQIEAADVDLRSATLRALSQCGYQAQGTDRSLAQDWIRGELKHAAWLAGLIVDIGSGAESALLRSALLEQLARSRERVLTLLAFGGNAAAIQRARDNLLRGAAERRVYALEIIDIQTPQALRGSVLPLLDDLSPEQRAQRLGRLFPQASLERGARLRELGANAGRQLNTWTQACALYTASALAVLEAAAIVTAQLAAPDPLIRETAAWLQAGARRGEGDQPMLSTIEKVIILRTVSIFAETSDEMLAEVAGASTEAEAATGETIFEKGEAGDRMYIIAAGRVRVHDGARTINELETGHIFGEMAVLDPQPRSASVTAVEDTHLLCLDQLALYELIDERPEVARGLLQVLAQHLRNRLGDLAELRARLPEPSQA